jgi:predicted DCC family thiol-disulfide oxidoreductase YuxK
MDAVILYDGECGLCHKAVDFVSKRDKTDRFRFASLQSEYSRRTLEAKGIDPMKLDSVVLVQGDEVAIRSDAVLGICRLLGTPYKMIGFASIIPKPIRDSVYSFIARNRNVFSRKERVCDLRPVEARWKFLDEMEPKR